MTQSTSPVSSLDNHRAAIAEYAELKKAEKKIKARLDELKKELLPVLEGRGKLVLDGYAFEVKAIAGRTTYDYKAMQEDGINIEPYKKTGKPSARFTVEEVESM